MTEICSAIAESWCPQEAARRQREEMEEAVREIALPMVAGENWRAPIDRAARRIGITWGQCKRLWFKECGGSLGVPGVLLDRVREVRAHQQTKRRRLNQELAELKQRLAHLEAQARETSDPEFNSTALPVDCP